MNTFKQVMFPIPPAWQDPEPELYINTFGVFASSGDFLWEQTSPDFCVHVIHDGEGVFKVGNQEYPIGPDTVFVFFPYQFIQYYDFPETPWQYSWFRLEGRAVERVLGLAGITRDHPSLDISDNPVFKGKLATISKQCVDEEFSPLSAISGAWELMTCLAAIQSDRISDPVENLAEAVQLFIDNQLTRHITVDELADHFRVNRSTLFRAFRKKYGISPKEYIDNRRFEKATQLLENSSLPIREIAEACGFEQHHYFTAAFRKRYNRTPSEFRGN